MTLFCLCVLYAIYNAYAVPVGLKMLSPLIDTARGITVHWLFTLIVCVAVDSIMKPAALYILKKNLIYVLCLIPE
ncbi:hypothetical protein SCG7086_BU_00020 [Chlamydiales bacterium SCGC AG-110-P3]|nr:hypothetical protein SCG7086_BU_00020 [Chlamydiales bacterium SCGC AG-110-P3]